MSVTATLTSRVEACLDRWNALPRSRRHELASDVTAASLALAKMCSDWKDLSSKVDSLERAIETAEQDAKVL